MSVLISSRNGRRVHIAPFSERGQIVNLKICICTITIEQSIIHGSIINASATLAPALAPMAIFGRRRKGSRLCRWRSSSFAKTGSLGTHATGIPQNETEGSSESCKQLTLFFILVRMEVKTVDAHRHLRANSN